MWRLALGSPLIRSVFKIGLFWQVAELRKEGRDGTCQVPTESSRGQSRINDRPAANLVSSLQVWWSGQPHPTLTVHPPGLSTLELYYTHRKKKKKNAWYRSESETRPHLKRLPIWLIYVMLHNHICYMIWFRLNHHTASSALLFLFPSASLYAQRQCLQVSLWSTGLWDIEAPIICMRTQPGLKSMHKSIRRLSIGAAVPSRDPHCCKKHWCARASCRNSFVYRGEFCRASSSRRKNPHHFRLSYNTPFLIHFCANYIRGRVLLWWK